MSDPLLRELDHYVVLEPTGGERILSAAETLTWLEDHLATLESPPADLAQWPDGGSRALRLLETACALELAPGSTIQWFAVRLEPPQG
ncbi:MAG: chlororespiratory reduction protein 7 [Synechococcus sp.]|nr:chlororespiratory reduction protein 7 [Synechococcus sp.]